MPADVVHESDTTSSRSATSTPRRPLHVLVVPRAHHADVGALAAADPPALAELAAAAGRAGRAEGSATGFRLVFNTGAEAGQTVFHVHGARARGAAMTWPPG